MEIEGIKIDNKFLKLLSSKFEKKIAKICKTKFALALNSGTDALTLSLHILGVKRGDEVITPSNSFIASTATIIHLGAKPIFIDVKEDQNIDLGVGGDLAFRVTGEEHVWKPETITLLQHSVRSSDYNLIRFWI